MCRSKHVEPSINFGIINSITKLHLVGISTGKSKEFSLHTEERQSDVTAAEHNSLHVTRIYVWTNYVITSAFTCFLQTCTTHYVMCDSVQLFGTVLFTCDCGKQ